MKFEKTVLDGVIVIASEPICDNRGWFAEQWNPDTLKALGDPVFIQENLSASRRRVFRGLHYQIGEHAQGKLVSCISGCVHDYVVDMRADSPTLGEWIKIVLDGGSNKHVWIPPGFAHGFYSIMIGSVVRYLVTAPYDPDNAITVKWDDPDINLPVHRVGVILSENDRNGISFINAPKF